ncbi:Hypothetical predicted protein, partial [Paramuricea clavata]
PFVFLWVPTGKRAKMVKEKQKKSANPAKDETKKQDNCGDESKERQLNHQKVQGN